MSLIGNSINSLPLAYAPLAGSGRYVAYAHASATANSAVSPVGSFIVDAGGSMSVSGVISSVGIKMTPASSSVSASATLSPGAAVITSGLLVATITAAIAALPTKFQQSALAVLAVEAGLSSVPLRIRSGRSDFTSLSTPVGVRSSGMALNTFSMNLGALNSQAGQQRQAFRSILTAIGSVVADRGASLAASSAKSAIGNVVFGGASTSESTVSILPMPNAIFGPGLSLNAAASVSPLASAIRTAFSTVDPILAAMSPMGNFIAGASKTLSGSASASGLPSVIFNAAAIAAMESDFSAIANLISSGLAELAALASTSMHGGKNHDGAAILAAHALLYTSLWYPLSVIESYIYANAWDAAQGAVSSEDTVYRPLLESTVYYSPPESVVFGEE